MFLNLLGADNVDAPTQILGESLSKEDIENYQNDSFLSSTLCYHGMLLAYFGEHVRLADSVVKAGHDYMQKVMVASPAIMFDAFLKGVSCFAAARETGKKKCQDLGMVLRRKIKRWLSMGNPNVEYFASLLDAEYMALRGKHSAAIKHYEAAIQLCVRGGYLHDAAFANERLGGFYLHVMKKPSVTGCAFSQSIHPALEGLGRHCKSESHGRKVRKQISALAQCSNSRSTWYPNNVS